MNLVKTADSTILNEQKNLLARDLLAALNCPNAFPDTEREEFSFTHGKTLFELCRYDETIAFFEQHLNQWPQGTEAGNSHLLLGLAYKMRGFEPQKFIEHGEQAILLHASLISESLLHVELFNAHLAMDQQEPAAEHLYQCSIVRNHPICFENSLWLANFYYKTNHQRAISCLQKILGVEESYRNLRIEAKHVNLESEVLKLASLLPQEQKIELLSALHQLQIDHPDIPWKMQRQVMFELASTHEAARQHNQAISLYDHLIDEACPTSSFYSASAMLARSRLLYSKLNAEKKDENDPLMQQVLANLKDLQIQKKLATEPLHLEAALEYADIRIHLAADAAKAESALFFLQRTRNDFLSQSVEETSEYKRLAQQFPQQAAFYNSYMKCILAETLLWESRLALQHQEEDKATAAKEEALTLFQQIQSDPNITPYLLKRVANKIETLR